MKYSIRYRLVKIAKKVGTNFDPTNNEAENNMKEVINSLPTSNIQFVISKEPNGDWVAESVNLSGILTGGTAEDNIEEMIKDAIFTYFEVPARFCDNSLIRSTGEPTIIKQEVFATA